jgi:hypothetical protein
MEYTGIEKPAEVRDELVEDEIAYSMDSAKKFWTLIDASTRGNPTRYINQSCAPNATAEEYSDHSGRSRFFFETLWRLDTGTQVTCDFGKDMVAAFPPPGCQCGVPICRSRGYGPMIDRIDEDIRNDTTGLRDRWHRICQLQTRAAALLRAREILLAGNDGHVILPVFKLVEAISEEYVRVVDEACLYADRAAFMQVAPILRAAASSLPALPINLDPTPAQVADGLGAIVELLAVPFIFPPPANRALLLERFFAYWMPVGPVPAVVAPALMTLYELALDYGIVPGVGCEPMPPPEDPVRSLLTDAFYGFLGADNPENYDLVALQHIQEQAWEESVEHLALLLIPYLAYVAGYPRPHTQGDQLVVMMDNYQRASLFLRRLAPVSSQELWEETEISLRDSYARLHHLLQGYVPLAPPRELRRRPAMQPLSYLMSHPPSLNV